MPKIIAEYEQGELTKGAAVTAMGLQTFDYAMPQPWLDDVSETVGRARGVPERAIYQILYSGIVWGYDDAAFGRPVALTRAANQVLAEYNDLAGCCYPLSEEQIDA